MGQELKDVLNKNLLKPRMYSFDETRQIVNDLLDGLAKEIELLSRFEPGEAEEPAKTMSVGYGAAINDVRNLLRSKIV